MATPGFLRIIPPLQFVETDNWALLGAQKNPSVVIEDFFENTRFKEKEFKAIFGIFLTLKNSSVKKYLVSPIMLSVSLNKNPSLEFSSKCLLWSFTLSSPIYYLQGILVSVHILFLIILF